MTNKTNVKDVKTEADKSIGTVVKFPVLTNQNVQFLESELKENKIVKDFVLSFFKDSVVVNALTWMNKPYEVVTDNSIVTT